MDFYIKKKATLPKLKMMVMRDGRSDYHHLDNLSGSTILFTMLNTETGILKIASKPAQIITGYSETNEIEYYVQYNFTPNDTKNVGVFKGQFSLKNDDGEIILPLKEDIRVFVQESFVSIESCCKKIPILTPTPTPTPTSTPIITPTATPVITPTPTLIPSTCFAYVVAEPQDTTLSLPSLGNYMYYLADGVTPDTSVDWYGFGNSGSWADPTSPKYSDTLAKYISYSGFSSSTNNFISPSLLKGQINENSYPISDDFGCSYNQYSFGSIEVSTSLLNINLQYLYTIWIPLSCVGGSMENMTLEVGYNSTPCSFDTIATPDPIISQTNVVVGSGAAIPSGIYRVLYCSSTTLLPITIPTNNNIYFKGVNKT
jgi:hypothetical protein